MERLGVSPVVAVTASHAARQRVRPAASHLAAAPESSSALTSHSSSRAGLRLASFRPRKSLSATRRGTVAASAQPEISKGSAPNADSSANGDGSAASGKDKKKGSSKGASSVSSGVRLENVGKTFPGAEVLKDISWEVKKGERVGLVGWNGAGKTTQLKIITGEVEPDKGEVIRVKSNMNIAYLTQEFELVMTRTVREEFLSAFGDSLQIIERLEAVQKELEKATDDMERMGSLLDELGDLQKKAQRLNIGALEGKVDKMMPTLGFVPERDNDRLVASFSGGWQMRIGLGKILLAEPDLILLDEPTNHIDIETIEWLEGYLKSIEAPMVIVSHDREFLDQLCTKIVEVERGMATTYTGNYSEFMRQKETAIAQAWAAWERQQKEIDRQTDLINRLSGGGQAGRAEAAKKALEKIQSEEQLLERPWVEKRRPFRFPDPPRSGRIVLRTKGLTQEYDGKVLLNNLDLLIERGERVAMVGPNGAGKSTLLRLLLSREKPTAGIAELGDHQVITNYFAQNQAEALDLGRTVQATLDQAAAGSDMTIAEIKSLLGRMGFKGDAVHKKVEFLSGGEKARLALAKFMVTPASLIVLDEPTNHLDIPSKEMLEEALTSFPGTVLAVSHDRYFLRRISTRVLEVGGGVVTDYEGDYETYLNRNDDAAEKQAERDDQKRELEKSQIKAKSKMSKAEKMAEKKDKARSFNAAAPAKTKGQPVKSSPTAAAAKPSAGTKSPKMSR